MCLADSWHLWSLSTFNLNYPNPCSPHPHHFLLFSFLHLLLTMKASRNFLAECQCSEITMWSGGCIQPQQLCTILPIKVAHLVLGGGADNGKLGRKVGENNFRNSIEERFLWFSTFSHKLWIFFFLGSLWIYFKRSYKHRKYLYLYL